MVLIRDKPCWISKPFKGLSRISWPDKPVHGIWGCRLPCCSRSRGGCRRPDPPTRLRRSRAQDAAQPGLELLGVAAEQRVGQAGEVERVVRDAGEPEVLSEAEGGEERVQPAVVLRVELGEAVPNPDVIDV